MSPFNIEEDNKDAKKMVHAAKYAEWSTMKKLMDSKPYLVNCIPEGSHWGVLHQAVYWNNKDAVNKILGMKTCDALIKTKAVRDQLVPPSSNAMDIADKMGERSEVKQMIQQSIQDERSKRFSADIPYKVSRKDGRKTAEELPLFIREVALYKDTLLGAEKHPKEHLIDIMKQIFKKEDHNWPKIEKQLHQALYGFDRAAADEIICTGTEEKFFAETIRLYTGNWVYKEVNQALAREFAKNYNPPAQDLALGLYALLFDMTISFWKQLNQMASKTYRGVSNKKYSYAVGQDIMFTTFVSSSSNQSVARGWAGGNGTLFIMDNSADTPSRPKNVKPYSVHAHEDEYVYAIGAEFHITAVENEGGLRKVHLELLKTCTLCGDP